MTREEVQAWVRAYAWLGTDDEKDREVECIMSQGDWEFIDGRVEKYVGQAWDPGAEGVLDEATEFALSSLYECHDGPHLDTCPRRK